MYGRHHSDDEDEDRYFYHGTSELMATELAAGPRSRSESSRKRMVSVPKVGEGRGEGGGVRGEG